MKKAKIIWNKFEKWVDRNLGFFLTNPCNHERMRRRFQLEDSIENL